MLSLPKCICVELSREGVTRTCPECCKAALAFWAGERVDQHELFEYLDSPCSVSALLETETGLVPIQEVLEVVLDDLPF